jgi:hypothetical protein
VVKSLKRAECPSSSLVPIGMGGSGRTCGCSLSKIPEVATVQDSHTGDVGILTLAADVALLQHISECVAPTHVADSQQNLIKSLIEGQKNL